MKIASKSVRMNNIHPRLTWALFNKIDFIMREALGYEPVITSGNDGDSHKRNSAHYQGRAADLRTWIGAQNSKQVSPRTRGIIANRIREAVGDDFDVLSEKDHIHIEYDPKVPT